MAVVESGARPTTDPVTSVAAVRPTTLGLFKILTTVISSLSSTKSVVIVFVSYLILSQQLPPRFLQSQDELSEKLGKYPDPSDFDTYITWPVLEEALSQHMKKMEELQQARV